MITYLVLFGAAMTISLNSEPTPKHLVINTATDKQGERIECRMIHPEIRVCEGNGRYCYQDTTRPKDEQVCINNLGSIVL